MLFGLYLLGAALLGLSLFSCQVSGSVESEIENFADASIEELINLHLIPNTKYGRIVPGDCPLRYSTLESLIQPLDAPFQNGMDKTDIMTGKQSESLDCQLGIIRKLINTKDRFSEKKCISHQCIKSFVEYNLSEYIRFCQRIGKQDVLKAIDPLYWMRDEKETVPPEDPSFMDRKVSEKLTTDRKGSCAIPLDRVELVLEQVENKEATWLAGFNVKFILSVGKQYVWNCDRERLEKHLEARNKYLYKTFTSAGKCLGQYYDDKYKSLTAYCDGFYANMPEQTKPTSLDDAIGEEATNGQRDFVAIVSYALSNIHESTVIIAKFLFGIDNDDFVGVRYEDALKALWDRYLNEQSRFEKGKSLRSACEDLTRELDLISFVDSYHYKASKSLEICLIAHQMCKLLLQAGSGSHLPSQTGSV